MRSMREVCRPCTCIINPLLGVIGRMSPIMLVDDLRYASPTLPPAAIPLEVAGREND
jgi:hypothetical protein